MSDETERNLEVARQLVSRWNAGDTDGRFLALYSDDMEMITSWEWPDPSLSGKLEFGVLLNFRDGLIVRHEWVRDPDEARAAIGQGT